MFKLQLICFLRDPAMEQWSPYHCSYTDRQPALFHNMLWPFVHKINDEVATQCTSLLKYCLYLDLTLKQQPKSVSSTVYYMGHCSVWHYTIHFTLNIAVVSWGLLSSVLQDEAISKGRVRSAVFWWSHSDSA